MNDTLWAGIGIGIFIPFAVLFGVGGLLAAYQATKKAIILDPESPE